METYSRACCMYTWCMQMDVCEYTAVSALMLCMGFFKASLRKCCHAVLPLTKLSLSKPCLCDYGTRRGRVRGAALSLPRAARDRRRGRAACRADANCGGSDGSNAGDAGIGRGSSSSACGDTIGQPSLAIASVESVLAHSSAAGGLEALLELRLEAAQLEQRRA